MEDDGGFVSPEWTPGIRYRRSGCMYFFFGALSRSEGQKS